MSNKLRTIFVGLVLAVMAAVLVPPLSAQTVEAELDQMSQRIEAARARQLQLIAPRSFARAAEWFGDARGRFERGGKIADIRRILGDANASLTEAIGFEEIGKVLLREALAARGDALAANAPEFAPGEWKKAEAMMVEAGRRVEAGDQNGAQARGSQATAEYSNAEFQAIRRDLLGKAQELRAAAVRVDANRKAAKTFGAADSVLRLAEQQLRGDRYARAEASQLARSAADGYRHATRLASIVDDVDRNRREAVENLVLDHEAQFARIVNALKFDASFSDGIAPVTDQVLDAIGSLYEDRDNLRGELGERSAELAASERRGDSLQARLGALVDSLGGQLAMVEQRERRVTSELRERQRREETLARVRAMFTPDQAEVLLSGSELVIRLYGLSFPVGSSDIKPANFSLLTTVQRVIREFPSAGIAIEGHTDSQGNDDFNQALSQRRAQAVRDYLIANMGLDENRIVAIGFGESRPIANNETADGRAKNRRIDARLYLPQN